MTISRDIWDAAVAGENDFIPVFCAWWEHEEYRMPYTGFPLTEYEKQLRETYHLSSGATCMAAVVYQNNCRGNEDTFRQEYPACPEEAFLMSGRPCLT